MKHIFWVHSTITFFISQSIIRYLNIDRKDILFLKARDFRINFDGYRYLKCDEWLNLCHPLTLRSLIKIKELERVVDANIARECEGDDFVAYIPTTSNLPCQLLLSNSNCKGYAIIEEGLANYRSNLYSEPAVKRSKATKLICTIYNSLNKRVYLNHPFLAPFKNSDLPYTYYYFDTPIHIKKCNHIYLPFFNDDYIKEYDYSGSVLFIMSPLYEDKMLSQESWREILEYAIDRMECSKTLFVKYHPAQSEFSKQLVEKCLQNKDIPYKVVGNEVPIELVLKNSKDVLYYGFESSVLIYASILSKNSKIFCFCNKLSEIDGTFSQFYKQFSNLFESFTQI